MFKFNNRNNRARCEICSKLTKRTPEQCQCHRSGVFIVNFELANVVWKAITVVSTSIVAFTTTISNVNMCYFYKLQNGFYNNNFVEDRAK